LVIIWITLGVLMLYLSHYLETTAVGSRLSYLYAQAHVLASATQAAGGPRWGVLWEIGGVPARGRVLLIDGSGKVVDDSAAAQEMRGRDTRDVAEVAAALAGKQEGNTYYLYDGLFTAYVAVPAEWEGAGGTGSGGGGPGGSSPGASGPVASGAVFITQDLSDIVSQYREIMGAVLLGGAVASVLSLIVAWGLSSVVLGPVLELSAVARRMASGRLDLRVVPKGPRESRDLAESFNYMASGIEKTMEAHEQFLIAAAHELRSPLAAMRAVVESMEIKKPELDELPGFFSDMRGELERIIHTTEEILDLLRAKSLPKDEKADAAAVVSSVVEERKAAARAKGVSLEFRGEGGLVSANPVILRLVASNLLDNALKFTGAGGSVLVTVSVRGDDFALHVSDTGVGIPEAELPRVFERFYRVDKARQRSTGGAGLGLAIVKEAAERSGGRVEVVSEVGKGSTFSVTWPGVTSLLPTERAPKP
jgi:two-component system OmpR family sensor kinase